MWGEPRSAIPSSHTPSAEGRIPDVPASELASLTGDVKKGRAARAAESRSRSVQICGQLKQPRRLIAKALLGRHVGAAFSLEKAPPPDISKITLYRSHTHLNAHKRQAILAGD